MGSELKLSDAPDLETSGSALRPLPRVATMPEAWYHPGAMGSLSLAFASRIGLSQVSRWALELATPSVGAGQVVRPPIDYWPWTEEDAGSADSEGSMPLGSTSTTQRRFNGRVGANPVVEQRRAAPVIHRGLPRTLIRRGGNAAPGTLASTLRPELVDPAAVNQSRATRSQSGNAQTESGMLAFKRMLEQTGRIETGTEASASVPPGGQAASNAMTPPAAMSPRRPAPPQSEQPRRSGPTATETSASPVADDHAPIRHGLPNDAIARRAHPRDQSAATTMSFRERTSAGLLDSASAPVSSPPAGGTSLSTDRGEPRAAWVTGSATATTDPNRNESVRPPRNLADDVPSSAFEDGHVGNGHSPPPTASPPTRPVAAMATTEHSPTATLPLSPAPPSGHGLPDAHSRPTSPTALSDRRGDEPASPAAPRSPGTPELSQPDGSAAQRGGGVLDVAPRTPSPATRSAIDRRLLAATELVSATSSPAATQPAPSRRPTRQAIASTPGPVVGSVAGQSAAAAIARQATTDIPNVRPAAGPESAPTEGSAAEAFAAVLRDSPSIAPRPLPESIRTLAAVIVGHASVSMRTDHVARRALAAAGKRAATTGSVIHLHRTPDPRADRALLAHELTHVAHPSPLPRFFDDDRRSDEERRAEDIARLVQRSPVLTRPAATPVALAGEADSTSSRESATSRRAATTTTPASAPAPAMVHEADSSSRAAGARSTAEPSSRESRADSASTVTAADLVRRLASSETESVVRRSMAEPVVGEATTAAAAPRVADTPQVAASRLPPSVASPNITTTPPKRRALPAVAPAAVIRRSPALNRDTESPIRAAAAGPASTARGAPSDSTWSTASNVTSSESHSSGETIRRSTAPTVSRTSSQPVVQRVETPTVEDNSQADDPLTRYIADLRSASGAVDFVDWIIDQIEDRMLSELQRRGGRFRGEF